MRPESESRQDLELTLQYSGARFDSHTLSCSDVQDIAIFEKMLTKIAKRKIERVGRRGDGKFNMKNTFYFELGKISEGSAKVGITVRYAPEDPSGMLPAMAPGFKPISCMEDAFCTLMEIFQGKQDRETRECFKLIGNDIKSFGKNLRESEEINFVESSRYANYGVSYNSETRKKISARARKTANRIVGSGRIAGARENGYVYVNSEDHGSFIFKGHSNKAKVSFDGRIGVEVEFVLEAELDQENKITRVKKSHYLGFAPKNSNHADRIKFCMEELEKYSKCEEGWLNGEGEKTDPAAIKNARKFVKISPELANRYLISPTPEGYIFIEFIHDGWRKCLEFSNRGVRAFGYDLGKKLDKFERLFTEPDSDLVEFISRQELPGEYSGVLIC